MSTSYQSKSYTLDWHPTPTRFVFANGLQPTVSCPNVMCSPPPIICSGCHSMVLLCIVATHLSCCMWGRSLPLLSPFSWQGLSEEQARDKLRRFGPNAITPPKQKSEIVKFLVLMFGGFSALLWIGSLLCFFSFGISEGSNPGGPKDNVRIISLLEAVKIYISI